MTVPPNMHSSRIRRAKERKGVGTVGSTAIEKSLLVCGLSGEDRKAGGARDCSFLKKTEREYRNASKSERVHTLILYLLQYSDF